LGIKLEWNRPLESLGADGIPEMLVVAHDKVQLPALVNFVMSPSGGLKICRVEIFGNEDQSEVHVQRSYKQIKIGCVRNRFQTYKKTTE
jgi:hypothetical protein